MSHSKTEDKFLETILPPVNAEGLKCLDVGTGYGETGLFLRSRLMNKGWIELHGIEPWPEYYKFQCRLGLYDCISQAKGQDIPYPNDFFNLSIAQQVIEHLDKKEGYKMIREMERVTQGLVILATPAEYYEGLEIDGNPFNKHRSYWSKEDFEKEGFKVTRVTKNINSRALITFANFWFKLRRKGWDNGVWIAYRWTT